MKRAFRRLVSRSFRVVITGSLAVISVYVFIMHRVTHDQSRTVSTATSSVATATRRVTFTLPPLLRSLATPPLRRASVTMATDPPSVLRVAIREVAFSPVHGDRIQKGDYFFSTVASLLNQSTSTQQKEITLVVILADRDQNHNNAVLQRIKSTYPQQLQSGLLLVVSAPDTEHIFRNNKIKRTFNDSIERVRWRSKQNLDYAALMEFCVPLATYYLQHIQDFVRANSGKSWAGLEVCPHGFIGKLFRSSDLPKLVSILRIFYLEMPCDFLIHHFYSLMLQKNVIRRKGTLFFHQGMYSSLGNVTRKVDRVPGVKAVAKASLGHQNPAAILYTSMKTYKSFHLRNAYNGLSKEYFWALGVNAGDSVTIVFTTPVKLDKVVIVTGLPGKDGRDKARNATVEVGKRAVVDKGGHSALCTDTHMLGEFKDGRFEVKVHEHYDAKCLTIVITHSQNEWLVIREIAVYPKL
ncbi:hypothetical protein BaRGS_00021488 [Batillaria attramentaria]|uniref:Alpha-1,3-mannosyl-glycoprotein 4-beta-N-acetylglucosaminyltransferase C n=1 Tax=Batillaria attramentaria TaxID=370345 RepID=A0ABD0KJ91_9CAEN